MSAGLLERLVASIESSVEVEPGKKIRFRRPLAAQMARFRSGITPELVCEFVVGWDGIVEADLLPKGVGSDAVAEFSHAVALHVLSDKPDWLVAVSKAMMDAMTAWAKKAKGAAKN